MNLFLLVFGPSIAKADTPNAPIKNLPAGRVLITGKTGTGKSQLICTLFGDPTVALTGVGGPVSQELKVIKKEGIALTLVDTPGFEVNSPKRFEDVHQEIIRRSMSSNPDEHYFACLLCINEAGARIEDCDIAIAELCLVHQIPLIVVLTRRMGNMKLREEAKKKFPSAPICPVNSVEWTDEDGIVHPIAGITELVEAMGPIISSGRALAVQNAHSCEDFDKKVTHWHSVALQSVEAFARRAGTWSAISTLGLGAFKNLFSLMPAKNAEKDVIKECSKIFGLDLTADQINAIFTVWTTSAIGQKAHRKMRIVTVGETTLAWLSGSLGMALAGPTGTVVGWSGVATVMKLLSKHIGDTDVVSQFGIRYCSALAEVMSQARKDLMLVPDGYNRIADAFHKILTGPEEQQRTAEAL